MNMEIFLSEMNIFCCLAHTSSNIINVSEYDF